MLAESESPEENNKALLRYQAAAAAVAVVLAIYNAHQMFMRDLPGNWQYTMRTHRLVQHSNSYSRKQEGSAR
ncbi:MAG TPA: hypothetical protein VKF38_13085 [Anaerolineaceae bacterium]|nr:hypothetical protein [Anaerolineaceae bacterium]